VGSTGEILAELQAEESSNLVNKMTKFLKGKQDLALAA